MFFSFFPEISKTLPDVKKNNPVYSEIKVHEPSAEETTYTIYIPMI
jgi:hypothetical protein